MAKKRAIGAIIKIDGEGAFRSSIKNCRTSLSALRASLKNVQSSYAGNANSLEALSAVQEKYAQMQTTAKTQVEKMSTAYEKSREAQTKTKETMLQMLEAYQKAEEALKEMKSSGTASADAIKEQQEATDKAYRAYQDYAEQVEKCGSRTAYFQKALEEAKGAEREAALMDVRAVLISSVMLYRIQEKQQEKPVAQCRFSPELLAVILQQQGCSVCVTS